MPSRNVIKIDVPDSYYHVYARGHGKHPVFRDEEDFEMFKNLFGRHLGAEEVRDPYGRLYPHLADDVSLLCYCLMRNHFHILLYQTSEGAMSKLMRGVMTSYSMYFNKKYGLSGALFESRYKASRISSDPYLMHISRYIHLNPKDWLGYPHSSIHSYFMSPPDWLKPARIIALFGSPAKYADFLRDYANYRESLDLIEEELANSLQ